MHALKKDKDGPRVCTWLIVLVAASVLPLLAITAFLMIKLYQDERKELTNDAAQRSHAILLEVEREFSDIKGALQVLGASAALAKCDVHEFALQAVAVLPGIHADSIQVMDAAENYLFSADRRAATLPAGTAYCGTKENSVGAARPRVSDLFIGPEPERQSFAVDVPVMRDGAVFYYLRATLDAARLGTLLTRQMLPPTWRAAIADGSGQLLTGGHDMKRLSGRWAPPELLQKMRNVGNGFLTSQDADDSAVLSVYSRSQESNWSVVISMPLDEVSAQPRQTLLLPSLAIVVALLFSLLLVWIMGRILARSIISLIQPALSVSAIEAPQIPRSWVSEVNFLGQALETGLNNLQEIKTNLRESDLRLALALDAAHLGIWIRDLVRSEIYVSERWRALFEFTPGQAITFDSVINRIHADDREMVKTMLSSPGKGVQLYETEYRIELPSGQLRWISSHGSIEYDNEGCALLARGISFDITHAKQREADLEEKKSEIIRLSRVSMLGELSGAIAHELNQPLSAILCNAQAAQRFLSRRPVDHDEIRDILQDIVDEDKRAGEIIRRLRSLFIARESEPREVDVNLMVAEVGKLLGGDLLRQGVDLHMQLATDLVCVQGDLVQLQQILINLIMNACDAMDGIDMSERRIIVRTQWHDASHIRITVTDHGPGVQDGAFDRIFDAFYSTKKHGMGLGLSICRNIIEANQGRLWGENNNNGGASFHFCVPMHTPNPG